MADRIFVIGDERLVLKLQNAEDVVQQEMYRAAVTASLWVETSAHMHVPHITGNLSRSIFTNVRRFRRRFEVEIGVSETAPYGVFVEKGTGIYGEYRRPFVVHRGSGSYMHKGMMARPFLAPAIDENAARIRELYNDVGNHVARRLN